MPERQSSYCQIKFWQSNLAGQIDPRGICSLFHSVSISLGRVYKKWVFLCIETKYESHSFSGELDEKCSTILSVNASMVYSEGTKSTEKPFS